MPKKNLIEVGLLNKIISFFASNPNLDDKQKNAIEKNSKLKKLYDEWNQSQLNMLYNLKKTYEKQGLDTSKIERLIADTEKLK